MLKKLWFLGVLILSGFPLRAQGASARAAWEAVTQDVNGNPVTGVTYNLYRSTNQDMSGKVKLNATTPITGLSFTDVTIPPTAPLYYQVHAVSSVGTEGVGSVIVRLNCSAPSNLTATAVSSSQISLAWTDNSNSETGFKVERKTGAGGTYVQVGTLTANVVSFQQAGLTPGTTYFFRVRATNAAGDSEYSNESSATTLPDVAPAAPPNFTVR